MKRTFHIDAHRSWRHQAIDLLIYSKDDVGGFWVARSPEMVSHVQGYEVQPTLRIDNDAAQALMDGLWECGVRPTAGAGSAGAMAATEKHLADMRRLAFAKHLPTMAFDDTRVMVR